MCVLWVCVGVVGVSVCRRTHDEEPLSLPIFIQADDVYVGADLHLQKVHLPFSKFHTSWANQKDLDYPGTIGLIHKEVHPCRSFFVQVPFERVGGSCLDSFFLQTIPFVDNTFREEVLS